MLRAKNRDLASPQLGFRECSQKFESYYKNYGSLLPLTVMASYNELAHNSMCLFSGEMTQPTMWRIPESWRLQPYLPAFIARLVRTAVLFQSFSLRLISGILRKIRWRVPLKFLLITIYFHTLESFHQLAHWRSGLDLTTIETTTL